MIPLCALLAAAAFAASPTPAAPSVFEISVHVLLEGEGQKIHDEIESRLLGAGGIELMTGRPDMIAFTFGQGTVPELRKKLRRAVAALKGVGVLRGEKERFNPTFEERKKQAQREIELIDRERKEIAAALEKTPLIRDYVELKVSQLEKIDPSKEERRSVLLVLVDGSSPPVKPEPEKKPSP